jgi:spore maturation protein CgeB
LLKNMSYSVLWVSNNLFMANIFDENEIIIDRDIWRLLEETERVIHDKRVDNYTRNALERVKREHTYVNRIEELFNFL